MIPNSLADAERMDADDPLKGLRSAFARPEGVLYLDGNSLGPMPVAAARRAEDAAREEWGEGLIRSWNGYAGKSGWIDLPSRAGAKIAALIGAAADEVVVADSVTVNLFKLAAALLAKTPGRALAVDADEFPTDGYVLEGLARLAGVPLLRREEGGSLRERNIGVFVKSLVHYKTAAIADIGAVESAAAAEGAAVIWDLSHAAGLLALEMKGAGARFAVGCGYKFLNGGPGAPAFLYCAKEEAAGLSQPLSGWMGHARPFDFAERYEPAPGILRFLAGTPSVLSLAALEASLDVFAGLAMREVEAKARALGDLFLARAASLGLKTVSPPIGARRGGHVALPHAHGYAVVQALIERGVIGDFRAPDLMRFGFSPLYLSYAETWRAADILADILATEEWRAPRFAVRAKVT